MDTIWFHEALERAGKTQADLARELGMLPSAVSRMLRGERGMKALEAVQVAQALGVAPDEVLRRAGEPSVAPAEPARRGRPPRSATAAAFAPAPRQDTMPIRSGARGGSNQPMFLDVAVGYTPRPANLAGVRDAYAIYMTGDSMEPRYVQGWLLHINPFKPPVRGRDVVIYKTDQEVLIKQFIGWNDDFLVLRQLNPDDTLRIPRGEVVECHLVVGVDQEG
jgi:phage repressor protein C with HTH and peptisase S24 domain